MKTSLKMERGLSHPCCVAEKSLRPFSGRGLMSHEQLPPIFWKTSIFSDAISEKMEKGWRVYPVKRLWFCRLSFGSLTAQQLL